MAVRVILAYVAIFACVAVAHAQDAVIYVNVSDGSETENLIVPPALTPELLEDLHSTKMDALGLYMEFTERAGTDLNRFLKNITGFANETVTNVRNASYDDEPNECRTKFESRMKKIEHDARRAASYSGESHHKFLLGHMIVFRMHLNKSEDYIKKCDNIIKGCGYRCESTPRVKRWLRLAAEEISRVRDDLIHSRRSYRDIVSHARRKLNHLRKAAVVRSKEAIRNYEECLIHA